MEKSIYSGSEAVTAVSQSLSDLLARPGVILLDGALGTELAARGLDLTDPLWSARLLIDAPAQIERVHLDYLQAGADVISTSTYQASMDGFIAGGLSRARARAMFAEAAHLALHARQRYLDEHPERSIVVLGSLGPFGAALANGSEYTGDYEIPHAELVDFHAERIDMLQQAGVREFACETIPSMKEAEAIAEAMARLSAPGWMSFCFRDETTLAGGDSIERLCEFAAQAPLLSIGVNCTAAPASSAIVETLRRCVEDVPIVSYPNRGGTWDARRKAWRHETNADFSILARKLESSGARLIGGCCGFGPADIAAARRAFFSRTRD